MVSIHFAALTISKQYRTCRDIKCVLTLFYFSFNHVIKTLKQRHARQIWAALFFLPSASRESLYADCWMHNLQCLSSCCELSLVSPLLNAILVSSFQLNSWGCIKEAHMLLIGMALKKNKNLMHCWSCT